jgi:hypothetical protein
MKRKMAIPSTEDGLDAQGGGSFFASETLLQVDLWIDSMGDAGADYPVPDSALALVSDLLAAEGDDVRESSPGSFSASFRDIARAVSAARHIQRLVTGYSRASTAGPVNACVTLMDAGEAGSGLTMSHPGDWSGLQRTNPGQVLFVGAICDSARSIPGLEFTELAASPEEIQSGGGAILQLLPPVHMEGYVDEPEESWTPIASSDSPFAQQAAWERAESAEEEPLAKRLAMRAPAARVPLSTGGNEAAAKPGMPRWAIFGVAGVNLVALAVAVLVFGPMLKNWSSKPAQPSKEPDGTSTTGQPPYGPSELSKTTTPQRPGATAPAVPAASFGPSELPRQPAAPKPANAAPAKQREAAAAPNSASAAAAAAEPAAAPVAAPAATPAAAGPGPAARAAPRFTYSQSELASLLARAEKDAGDGKYDQAIREFKIVLEQEPSNVEAKQGLERAERNKSHQ